MQFVTNFGQHQQQLFKQMLRSDALACKIKDESLPLLMLFNSSAKRACIARTI
jgi:hypothetical protein